MGISRCHAMIRFQQGQFMLEDNHSKFDTLVAMKKPRLLKPGAGVSIQMGRTVLSLSAQLDVEGPDNPGPFGSPSPSNSAADERQLRLSLLNRGWGPDQPDVPAPQPQHRES